MDIEGQVNLRGQVGDSLTAYARVSDVDLNGIARPRSLANATLTARVRYGNTPDSDVAPDNLRAVVDNAEQGIVRVTLPHDHTLPARVYFYEVDLAIGGTNETIMRGRLTITATLIE